MLFSIDRLLETAVRSSRPAAAGPSGGGGGDGRRSSAAGGVVGLEAVDRCVGAGELGHRHRVLPRREALVLPDDLVALTLAAGGSVLTTCCGPPSTLMPTLP